jgi:hypothetical protein
MNKKRRNKIINNARNRRRRILSNPDKNKPHFSDTTNWEHTLEKRFVGMPFDLQKKYGLDQVLGKDSINMVIQKISEYIIIGFDKYSEDNKGMSKEQLRVAILNEVWSRLSSCSMIKYIAKEINYPKEYEVFLLQIVKDLIEEYLGIRDYKKYEFDNRYLVQLIWQDDCYMIEHNNIFYTLDCETDVIFGDWVFHYNHFDEASPWNNGTFSIFWKIKNIDHPNDHVTISLDHYTLFEEYFDNEMIYASDLARMVNMFTREYKQDE